MPEISFNGLGVNEVADVNGVHGRHFVYPVTGEVALRHEDCYGAPAPSPTSKMERSDILLVSFISALEFKYTPKIGVIDEHGSDIPTLSV
jgi:hypothetical protein